MKEMFIEAHERLTEAYMERTGCDWATAYEATADAAWDAMREDYADRIDQARQMHKDGLP